MHSSRKRRTSVPSCFSAQTLDGRSTNSCRPCLQGANGNCFLKLPRNFLLQARDGAVRTISKTPWPKSHRWIGFFHPEPCICNAAVQLIAQFSMQSFLYVWVAESWNSIPLPIFKITQQMYCAVQYKKCIGNLLL